MKTERHPERGRTDTIGARFISSQRENGEPMKMQGKILNKPMGGSTSLFKFKFQIQNLATNFNDYETQTKLKCVNVL